MRMFHGLNDDDRRALGSPARPRTCPRPEAQIGRLAIAAVANDGRFRACNLAFVAFGIPFYKMANGDDISSSIEEIFRWKVHHLRPCRNNVGADADALQSASS